jgi:site-specific DNA-cytosine methylase
VKRGVNIEVFSCSGGMAEGFRRAGITFDFVFDKDPNAVVSYTKNLGHAPIQMDVRDVLRLVRGVWSPGPVELFVADPAERVKCVLPGPAFAPRPAWVTCREALQHLPLEELGRPVRLKLRPSRANGGNMGGDETRGIRASRANTGAQGGAALLLDQQSNRMGDPDAPSLTITSKESRSGVGGDKVLEWPWSRDATTIWRDERLTPAGHHGPSCLSGDTNAIVLSERAAAILQGFPADWLFSGDTKKARWSQIGQAMPPPLAHAVANSVRDAMERAKKGAA